MAQSGFTKNAKDVVQPGQKVTVKVLSVDAEKKRVSLELKSAGEAGCGAGVCSQFAPLANTYKL